MTETDWKRALGQLARDYIRSAEMERYFSVKMTKPRAAAMEAMPQDETEGAKNVRPAGF